MTIWLVTGLTDSRWAANIAENHARLGGELVVVENGARWTGPTEHVHVILSDRGVAKYMNAGLDYVRAHAKPDDWVLKCDSDDYYEERFARDILDCDGEACACASIYVETDDGDQWFVDFGVVPGAIIQRNIALHGPTMAVRVRHAVDVPEPDSRGFGEDLLWGEAIRARGVQWRCLPPDGFVWCRHGVERGHAFPVHGRDILHMFPAIVTNVATGERFTADPERRRRIVGGLTMRHIKRDAGTIKVDMGGEVIDFGVEQLIRAFVDTQPKFNSDAAGIRTGVRILGALDGGGETIDLDPKDWQALRDVAESPEGGYPIVPRGPGRVTFAAIIDAITEA